MSWVVALLERCLAVPIKGRGDGAFGGLQRNIVQEVVVATLFIAFAAQFLKAKRA